MKQEWRWCLRCRRLFKNYPTKFCPFDDWYLTDQPPAFVPIRWRRVEHQHLEPPR